MMLFIASFGIPSFARWSYGMWFLAWVIGLIARSMQRGDVGGCLTTDAPAAVE
jgi:hypothetical protein